METHYPPTYRISDACESEPAPPRNDDRRMGLIPMFFAAVSGAVTMLGFVAFVDWFRGL